MSLADYEDRLKRFQDFGDTDSLLEYVRGTGGDPQQYLKAIETLAPVFDALSVGMQPGYEKLDHDALRRQTTAVEDIVKWMADSKKADMKTVAIELMGVLGWKSFLPNLENSLSSEFQWERLTAIKALGQTATERTLLLLRNAAKDSDQEIRDAARRVLKRLDPGREDKLE